MKSVCMLFAIFCLAFLFPNHGNAIEDFTLSEKTILDQHGAVILLLDPDNGNIIYANNAAKVYYGYLGNTLTGMSIFQVDTQAQDKAVENLQKAKAKRSNTFVTEHKLKSGDLKTVEIFADPVTVSGRPLLFSIIHDITDATILAKNQNLLMTIIFITGAAVIVVLLILSITIFHSRKRIKSAMEKLEYTQKLHTTFIDADDRLIYLKDENLKYVLVNKVMEDFYQRTKEQIIGCTDFDLSEEEFARIRLNSDLHAMNQNTVVVDEMEWDGKTYRTLKFPVPLPSGTMGLGAYVSDITKARENENIQKKAGSRNKILADMLSMSFDSRQSQLEYVLKEMLSLTESCYGHIYLFDEQQGEMTLAAVSGSLTDNEEAQQQYGIKLHHDDFWGEAARKRQPVIKNQLQGIHQHPFSKSHDQLQVQCILSVPVIVDDHIAAVVDLANKKTPYTEDDVNQTLLLLNGVWNAVIRREYQEKLSYERTWYQQTLFSIGDGVMVVDPNGIIEILNPAAKALTGWDENEAVGKYYKEILALAHESPDVLLKDPVENVLQTHTMHEIDSHAVLTSRNGQRYYLEDSAAPIKDESGALLGVVLVFRNVSEKKEQQREIEYLSFHDSLTGLYNRRFLEEELSRLDTPRNLPLSIIIGDVNNLKLTNDVFGHTYGDMLLVRLAKVLRNICRADDIIARWGGDEFALLLPHTTQDEAKQIVARIRNEYAKEKIKAVHGSVSMGTAAKLHADEILLQTVNKAEEDMYTSKIMEHSEVMKGTLHAIVQMLHDNSSREREHSETVSKLCQAMGRKLNMTEDEIKRLQDAGYLHDIGKVVLDNKLLNGHYNHLSVMEWNEIKRHPVVGFRILNAFDDMLDIAQIVLAHQERWDGTGYPKGLKGEEIPVAARIIALAESYERRLHGAENAKPMSKEAALEAIRNNKERHFDPVLADLFVDMMENESEY